MEWWQVILTGCGAVVTIGGAVAAIGKVFQKAFYERLEKLEKASIDHELRVSALEKWTEAQQSDLRSVVKMFPLVLHGIYACLDSLWIQAPSEEIKETMNDFKKVLFGTPIDMNSYSKREER